MDDITCLICKTEFPIERYGDGHCPKCNQYYEYEEDHRIVLTEEQIILLKANKNLPPNK